MASLLLLPVLELRLPFGSKSFATLAIVFAVKAGINHGAYGFGLLLTATALPGVNRGLGRLHGQRCIFSDRFGVGHTGALNVIALFNKVY